MEYDIQDYRRGSGCVVGRREWVLGGKSHGPGLGGKRTVLLLAAFRTGLLCQLMV